MQAIKPITKPSKQRKMLFQAPDHIRHKFFSAPLSPELRKSHGVKSLPVRMGDTVRIMRGDHKGVEGKVTRIDRKKYRIFIEGLTREKVDGTTTFIPIHPSKVMITRLNLDDKWRNKILKRKKEAKKKVEGVAKPPEVAEVEEKVVEEKVVMEEKPKRRKRKVTRKKGEEKAEETKKEKPKTKKTKAKRKTADKTEEET
ncbi:MAG: 50S ribosomal protein L24 [Candidatus Bathyarchaeia archaeon]